MDGSAHVVVGRGGNPTRHDNHPFPAGAGGERLTVVDAAAPRQDAEQPRSYHHQCNSSGREGSNTEETRNQAQWRGQKRQRDFNHNNHRHRGPRQRNHHQRPGERTAAAGGGNARLSSSSATIPSLDCVVCGCAQAKYKCPKCLARYCSVECCRRHKEVGGAAGSGEQSGNISAAAQGCQGRNASEDGAVPMEGTAVDLKKTRYGVELEKARRLLGLPPTPIDATRRRYDDNNNSNSYEELEEGWKLTDRMVSSMNECDWLKRELQDDSLRQLVLLVTTAPNVVVSSPTRRMRSQIDQTTEQERVLDRLKSELPHFRHFLDRLLVVAGVLERPRRRTDGSATDVGLLEWLEQIEPADSERLTLVPLPRQLRPSSMISKDGKGSNSEAKDSSEETSDASASSDDSSSEDTDSSGSRSDGEESEGE